jgi:DNA topoisomerase-1
MAEALIIVESPAKARTISRYLGSDYVVESSIGHIRDLPSNATEIPPRYKKEPWARMGINVDEGFRQLYIIPASKKAQVKKLKDRLKGVEVLYLATDEDREGEAIAWPLAEVLKPKVPVSRMVFPEITKSAITRALDDTRSINQNLVNAQEARRLLDRLVGYEVSPLLWRKIRPKLSAGRVQSVATRMVVERERARIRFVEAEFWGLDIELRDSTTTSFATRLTELGGRKVAVGKDFDPDTGVLTRTKAALLDRTIAERVAHALADADVTVADVASKPFTNRPYAPFMTSTLQQEAGRKLRFGARRTMRIAQSLYENGYITYMRTDSTTLSGEAISLARRQVQELYGAEYLPDKPRVYSSKSKNAQEAHEAIRPAGERIRTPQSLRGELDGDQLRLYELIWKRTLASQMKDATGMRTTVRFEAPTPDDGTATLTTSGKVISFPGFLRAYVEGSDDPNAELADQEKVLPPMKQGQTLPVASAEATSHTTQPPARFTEASLVKELESQGIGRPSTYATIIQTIQDRGYVWKKATALVPTFTAFAVTNLLEQHLPDLVDYDFTARLEDELDGIARGELDLHAWLEDFFSGRPATSNGQREIRTLGLRQLVADNAEAIDPREVSRLVLGEADDGGEVAVRVGRYGPYVQIGDSDKRASVPDDLPPDELTVARALELIESNRDEGRELGADPDTGKTVFLRNGRYGWYVQLGENETNGKSGKSKKNGKAKMASVWPTMDPSELSLDDALMLLSYPREVGVHPESGKPITAQDGRFGPYLKMGTESRSLPDHEALRTTTLDQAVAIFAQPKRRGSASSSVLKELGPHPGTKLELSIRTGRFGPYITDGVVNASVPKGRDPDGVTLEDAVELIAKREAKLRSQGKDPRAPKKKGRSTRAKKK